MSIEVRVVENGRCNTAFARSSETATLSTCVRRKLDDWVCCSKLSIQDEWMEEFEWERRVKFQGWRIVKAVLM